MKKYDYYKVIQQNWGTGWDDVDFYETDSRFWFKSMKERGEFLTNLKLYRTEQNAPVRVINRRELNPAYQEISEQTQDELNNLITN